MRRCVLLVGLACASLYGQSWTPLDSGTTADLRGISAVSDQVVWASGTKATILKTVDGGANWQSVGPPGVADLDFRDIEAFDDKIAYAMSAGEGRLSRLYKSIDGGMNWTMLRMNLIPDGFWNAIAFWDKEHGILMGDPVNGRFTILTTSDGGGSWKERQGPKAEKGEAAFAASGTALIARGSRDAWFVTGGLGGGRVFHSDDGGDTWTVARTPLMPASKTAGLYSIAFDAHGQRGVAVGGDYTKPDDATGNMIVTSDGGKTWNASVSAFPRGYRSAVAQINLTGATVPPEGLWFVAGPTGAENANVGDNTFRTLLETPPLNALAVSGGDVWAVGPKGTIILDVLK